MLGLQPLGRRHPCGAISGRGLSSKTRLSFFFRRILWLGALFCPWQRRAGDRAGFLGSPRLGSRPASLCGRVSLVHSFFFGFWLLMKFGVGIVRNKFIFGSIGCVYFLMNLAVD